MENKAKTLDSISGTNSKIIFALYNNLRNRAYIKFLNNKYIL